jgi:hypothetical protein
MLVVRDAQIQQFVAPTERDLVKAVCDAVIKSNPARVEHLRPLRIIAMVKIGIERARSVGVTRPEDVAAFVALMFEISPKFYKHPLVAQVLADGNYPMGERITQLPKRIEDDVWEEIANVYDANFWFPEVQRS